MNHDNSEFDNELVFMFVCTLQGHTVEYENIHGLVPRYYVDLSVRQRILIRRLKWNLDREGVVYGTIKVGKNTRYLRFVCRVDSEYENRQM